MSTFPIDISLPGFRVSESSDPLDFKGAFPLDQLAPFRQGWLGNRSLGSMRQTFSRPTSKVEEAEAATWSGAV